MSTQIATHGNGAYSQPFRIYALAGTAAFASTYTAFGKSLYEGSVDLWLCLIR
jgi:hypothetical protein